MQHEQTLPAGDLISPYRPAYALTKRILDVTVATLVLLCIAPILLLIVVLIRLDSPGPVLFRQQRLGQGGRPFTFYKFRTMTHNADQSVHEQFVLSFIQNRLADHEGAAPGMPYKLGRDKRITRVGGVLRRTSLDELPQLFNVVRGEMSLVGPRPPIPYEIAAYQEWHLGRLAVTPGITGWWQVWGRSRVQFDEMVEMDLAYIAKQSLWLDLKILVLTIPAVVLGKGAK